MSYEIHIKQGPPEVVVTERRHATLGELGDLMQSTLSKVASAVEPRDAARGVPFAVYYNEPFRPEDGAEISDAKGVQRRTLGGGPVAYTTHEGPYTTIGAAYDALYAFDVTID